MDPLAPEFTPNLVRKTARIMAGMDRVIRPGGIATDEGLSSAVHAGMQHLAAHKGDVHAAITSAKAAGAGWTNSVTEVAAPASKALTKAALHHKPAAAPSQLSPQPEHPSEPRAVWHGSVPTSQSSINLPRSVARFVFNHPLAALAALGTEIIGGGPPDPAADGAAGAEIALSEGAVEAGAKAEAEGAAAAAKATVPSGFASAQAFSEFGSALDRGLADAGYNDAQGILQGSAVTGRSYRTGDPFDVGRESDLDIGIFSKSLFEAARKAGIKLRSGGTRTGPLDDDELAKLNLSDLAQKLRTEAGRDVNFMIYNSMAGAVARGPSIIIPK